MAGLPRWPPRRRAGRRRPPGNPSRKRPGGVPDARAAPRRVSPTRLNPQDCIAYLLDLGLLDRDTLVERGVQVEEVAGRNLNLRVRIDGGLGYFLKQTPPHESGLDRPLAAEAALYRWAALDRPGDSLASTVPRLIHYDSDRAILILELIPPESQTGQSVAELLPTLARTLARWHGIRAETAADLSGLGRDPPWFFDLTRPSPDSLRELAPAQLTLLQTVQADPTLAPIVAGLRNAWAADHVIHGDLKGPNIVAVGGGERLLLVDWELVQWGDSAWDLGGVFQAVIVEDLLALDLPEQAGAQEAMESFGGMVAARKQGWAAFWDGYRTAGRLGPVEAGSLRERLAPHTGLRLIKTAYEWCQSETRMPGKAAAILQLGLNMMRDPESATPTVLGLSG